MANITIRRVTHYGTTRRYVTDANLATAIHALTNRLTLSESDITALLALGHTFTEEETRHADRTIHAD